MQILDSVVPNIKTLEGNPCTFLDLIELVDVRVYKTRGTDPRAEISRFAHSLSPKTKAEEIGDWLIRFNKTWMTNGLFEANMKANVYDNAALAYIYIDYCEHLRTSPSQETSLKKFVLESPTIEHILAQHPTLSLVAAGFQNETEFANTEHKLGNLSILEKRFNSAVRNKNPIEKKTTYDKSGFRMTRELSTKIASSGKFDKKSIEDRTEDIWKYLAERWWC